MRESDPKSFWNLYSKLNELDKKHKINPIPPEEWVRHYTELLNTNTKHDKVLEGHFTDFIENNKNMIFNELNFKISEAEVQAATANLKVNKAAGIDGIISEIVKASSSFIMTPLHSLFNRIFLSGYFPKLWRVNTLSPLHKKGNNSVTDNYRGIAVGCCLAKLFLSVLHNRLQTFIDANDLIPNCQIGYKKGTRTSDHILTLKNIIDKYILSGRGKYLYTCFVDYKSAFDTVWRKALFYKLLSYGVGGNFLSILQNMYDEVYYCVKLDQGISEKIPSNTGVKQGCVISPTLFNMFLADFPDIFDDNCAPITLNNSKLNCLMFADDIVLMSESASGLQTCLDKLDAYTKMWHLKVNTKKTKIIIFNKGGKKIQRFHFTLASETLEIAQSYCYLGITFTSSGNFNAACSNITDRAMKAFFKLKQINPRENALLTIKLFDSLVMPILMYGCEVWGPLALRKVDKMGFKSLCDSMYVEELNIKLCKYVLGVGKYATNAAVIGELGRYPVALRLILHSYNYWKRIKLLHEKSFVKNSYIDSLLVDKDSPLQRNWSSCFRHILTKFDPNLQWNEHTSSLSGEDLHQLMCTEYEELWLKCINKPTNNKLRTYAQFKKKFKIENYILSNCLSDRKLFSVLRISCHRLAIETGRYTTPKTPAEDRICLICNTKSVEDEYHMTLVCPYYNKEREELFLALSEFCVVTPSCDPDTFLILMGYLNGDTELATLICSFFQEMPHEERTVLSTSTSLTFYILSLYIRVVKTVNKSLGGWFAVASPSQPCWRCHSCPPRQCNNIYNYPEPAYWSTVVSLTQ